MIDPKHVCSVTSSMITDIRFHNDGLSCHGASLRVLLAGLYEHDLIWYSLVYGDFNDDVDVVATRESFEESELREEHDEEGPVAKAIGDLFPIHEYKINDAAAGRFGLQYEVDQQFGTSRPNDSPELPDTVVYLVSVHDDCFSLTRPISDQTVERVLDSILQMHAFYVGQDVQWGGTSNELLRLLREQPSIRLKAHKGKGRESSYVEIQLPAQPRAANLWLGLGYRSTNRIEIRASEAVLRR